MHRSLDLTGPLLLGGVPNLPEDFPVRNRDFVGCMRNLRIDSRAIDMDSYVANNGTTAGEAAQKSDTQPESPLLSTLEMFLFHKDLYCQYIVQQSFEIN